MEESTSELDDPWGDDDTSPALDIAALGYGEDARGALREIIAMLGDAIEDLRRKQGKGPAPGPDASLARATDRVTEAFGALLQQRGDDVAYEACARIAVATAFVVAKARRISTTGPTAVVDSGDGFADWDTSCNVVLLVRSIDALRRSLGALEPTEPAAAFQHALDALADALAPWNERISEEFIKAFQELVRDGAAPSPFCTTDN